MKPIFRAIPLCILAVTLGFAADIATAADSRCFEMRSYYAAPGKMDALLARFRDHTCKLFEKHGMTNIGYWLPLENPDNKLVYILAYPSREDREKSWKAFSSDPDWKAAMKASEANGKLLVKVESVFLKATEFSPEIKPCAASPARTFQLRTYTASGNNLPNLLNRFRDYTVRLFKQHGMESFGYWTPVDKKQGADNTLIYILCHKSKEEGETNLKAFRADPEWVKAKAASEQAAGGSLTVKVEPVFMQPTDFSPTK